MWERANLKQRAKDVLRGSYWKAFLVSLAIGILGGQSRAVGGAGGNGMININIGNNTRMLRNGHRLEFVLLPLIGIILITIFVLIVGSTLEVGGRRYFIQGAQGDINMGYLGDGFKKQRYVNITITMFWRSLITFLWTLLLIIPGIVKSYAYSMVPYILADNPEIGYKRALELSDQMTQGEKWNIVVLDFSFIGWYLLGTLLFGIGTIFVIPYENATKAELYLELRKRAIDNGHCDYRELNLVRELKTIE